MKELVILMAAMFVVWIALWFALSHYKSKIQVQVIDYVSNVLDKLHMIKNGVEYIGKNAKEINAFRKVMWSECKTFAEVEMLCVTAHNNWFKYKFDCNKSKHTDLELIPLTTDEAKEILGSRPDIYKQYFDVRKVG